MYNLAHDTDRESRLDVPCERDTLLLQQTGKLYDRFDRGTYAKS